MSSEHVSIGTALRGQPAAVWVTAFAAVIAFMGIGLVDPILRSIAEALNSGPETVTLLFSSYLGVQVLAMLVTGAVSSRIGFKRTLVLGLVLIVVATALCAASGSIGELIALRGVWGLGNALFIATALTFIIGAASGGQQGAILLYEAALGLGLSMGPLLGAALGSISWRGPFAGTAVLMCIALLLCLRLRDPTGDGATGTRIGVTEPLRALRFSGLRRTALGSALYTAAFFTVLAWAPFVIKFDALGTGLVFFGWGLAVAFTSVLAAPWVTARIGERWALLTGVLAYAAVLLAMGLGNTTTVVIAIVVSGLISGLLNTVFTGTAMSISPVARPVASAGYNFCRWLGGAVAALLVGHVAHWLGSPQAPFLVTAGLCVIAGLLILGIRDQRDTALPASAALVGEEF